MRYATCLIAFLVAACASEPSQTGPDARPGNAPDGAAAGRDGAPVPADIYEFLLTVPGMTSVVEETSEIDGYRFFLLEYEQPADHDNPDGATFTQRMSLTHRDRAAPMVLYTSGYYGSTRQGRAELTRILTGNQIRTEQRFFSPSRPDPANWTDLDIEQAAGDHHRIVTALKRYYDTGAWLATGASKGGMTSVFHRRFHPGDLDGVVAYVAPISFGTGDARYVTFLEQVGTADCRAALANLQRELLIRRDAMKARMADLDTTFDIMTPDGALESAVMELPFGFWQYYPSSLCGSVPDSDASDSTLFQWLDQVGSVGNAGDDGILYYQPYYYQSFTQLGYPAIDTSHLSDLLLVEEPSPSVFMPNGMDVTFDGEAMPDIADWVATSGSELMFIYGENDPWTAGAFDLGDAVDSYSFTVPGGTHGANIADLPETEQQQALDVIGRWAGVSARIQPLQAGEVAENRRAPIIRPR